MLSLGRREKPSEHFGSLDTHPDPASKPGDYSRGSRTRTGPSEQPATTVTGAIIDHPCYKREARTVDKSHLDNIWTPLFHVSLHHSREAACDSASHRRISSVCTAQQGTGPDKFTAMSLILRGYRVQRGGRIRPSSWSAVSAVTGSPSSPGDPPPPLPLTPHRTPPVYQAVSNIIHFRHSGKPSSCGLSGGQVMLLPSSVTSPGWRSDRHRRPFSRGVSFIWLLSLLRHHNTLSIYLACVQCYMSAHHREPG
ncbi:hypothetical protein SKAU_G00202530 [Synaphobranchus kaupii]|uniref:Uncharacterized protein n=1 Tax=Synaphobranchus kaupii TaxID=118154 RepID=A0A9Q1IXG0_SYNKA|nr:hypothetical protein SKAU_G00202530 [Synaphobranchus kaupii]